MSSRVLVRAPDVPVPGEFGVLAKVHVRRHHRPFAGRTWSCTSGRRLDLQEQNAFLATPRARSAPCRSAGIYVFDCRVGGILQAISSSVGDSAKRMPNAQHFWRPAAHNKGHMYILITASRKAKRCCCRMHG
jgi:hypothetical protein